MDYQAKEQLFRRMIFNVLSLNRDDHTKNFSFMYENGEWKLSPAYDLIFAYDPESYWLRYHNININGKNDNISREDLVSIGEKFNIKKAEKIFSQIKEIISNFDYYANKYHYPAAKAERISYELGIMNRRQVECNRVYSNCRDANRRTKQEQRPLADYALQGGGNRKAVNLEEKTAKRD
jgi:hypothetical protein